MNEINVPTLIIIGNREEENVTTISEILALNIRGAQKVIIPNTAHLANMEEPEMFNKIVLEFLHSARV